jgi:hypothetical protein
LEFRFCNQLTRYSLQLIGRSFAGISETNCLFVAVRSESGQLPGVTSPLPVAVLAGTFHCAAHWYFGRFERPSLSSVYLSSSSATGDKLCVFGFWSEHLYYQLTFRSFPKIKLRL